MLLRFRSLAAGLLAALGLAACGEPSPDRAAPSSPRRIVALTVGAADTLSLLGALDRVVGVEEDCFVPGTEHVVKIRNDDHAGPSKALNVEAILALQPDLVVAKEDLAPLLSGRGFATLWVPADTSFASIERLVTQLGERVDLRERARDVLAQMHEREASIRERVQGLPRVRVYFEAGRPGRSVGNHTVVGRMLALAGAVNIAGDSSLANPQLSAEAILAADPEVIVLSPWGESPAEVSARPGWSALSAVRDGRVHKVEESDRKLQYPSPSCVIGCDEVLLGWIHPELAREARR